VRSKAQEMFGECVPMEGLGDCVPVRKVGCVCTCERLGACVCLWEDG
jgi:hypothetical protein